MTFVPTVLIKRLPSILAVAGAITIALLLLVDRAPQVTSAAAHCDGPGLANAGFEGATLDGLPDCWDVVQPLEEVAVVDTEDGSEFKAYDSLGITVEPYEGSQMLRMGGPKRINEKQGDGPDVVSQTFLSEETTLSFAFRLFSWEHRDQDQFGFELTDAAGLPINATIYAAPGGEDLTPNLDITMVSGEVRSCDTTPCLLSIDVGDRQDFLNTGWYEVLLDGLPIDEDVTLTLITGGTDNNAHATWAYFDKIPLAPTAIFDLSFATVLTAGFQVDGALEGSVVQFVDLSVDPNNDIESYAWVVTYENPAPGDLPITSSEQFPIFVPPQDGQYAVQLTVTDAEGNSDTTESGTAIGDLTMPYLNVANSPPLVDALNMEVLEGEPFELRGAYIDSGWLDTHEAVFELAIAETIGPVTIDATSEPALASGVVTADATLFEIMPAGLFFDGELRVTDALPIGAPDADHDGVDAFTISVVADEDRHELGGTNDSFDTVLTANATVEEYVAQTDHSILSYLSEVDERDFFELRWADGNDASPFGTEMPAGSELLVTLESPTASDYDLAILAVTPAAQALGQQFIGQQFIGQQFIGQQFIGQQFIGQQFIGQQFIGQQFIGQQFIGQQFIGQQFIGQQFIGQQFIGQQFIGQQFIGQQFIGQQFIGLGYEVNGFQLNPLSQIAALDGSVVGGTDISLNELDLELPDGVTLLGFAANSGDLDDGLLVSITEPGTRVFAVVVRSDMPTSPEPYRLTVRGSVPPLQLADAAGMSFTELDSVFGGFGDLAAACEPTSPLVTTGATLAPQLLHDGGGLTVFLTQRERMIEIYGLQAWDDMYASLVLLADDPLVQGRILSTSSTGFDDWDTNPCSVQEANDTASGIRAELLPYLDGTSGAAQYIVLIGNDDVIPFYRVADTTTIGNESNYAMGTFLKPGSPLFHSTDEGYILTQDFYADLVPTPYEGGALYVPDLPIGRLVETPLEIQAQANAFVASDGQLAVETAAVAGYDFFSDYSDAVADELDASGVVNTNLTSNGWTADELRCDWGLIPNQPVLDCGIGGIPDVSSAAAHYTHWAALSAGGFFNEDYNDYISSTEFADLVPDDGVTPSQFQYHLGFTIGCHAGFIVPDDDVVDGVFPFNPALDLAQAMAQNRALWVASTGYAIGDDEALNYTELLMLYYAEGLLTGSGYAGQALVDAKLAYLGALGTITNYDQKVSIEMTLYGLPHYRAEINPDGLPVIEAQLNTLAAHAALPDGPGDTHVETQTFLPKLERHPASSGSYDAEIEYSDGDYETVPGRPIMPRIVAELAVLDEGPVHGAVMVSGTYSLDSTSPTFDPWVGVPMLEWTEVPPEAQVCLPIYWPTPVKLNSIGNDAGVSQRAIVYPAAFRCESGSGVAVTGSYRMFNSQTVELYRSLDNAEFALTDYTPPIIHEVNISESAISDGIVMSVDTSDSESGVASVLVVRYRDSSGTVSSFSTAVAPSEPAGVYDVEVPNFETGDQFVVHVIDAAGNVGTNSAKGYLLQFIDVDAQDVLAPADLPVVLTATVHGYAPGTSNATGLAQPSRFLWDFGDEGWLSGELNAGNPDLVSFDVDGNGDATFSVLHSYAPGTSGLILAGIRVVDSRGGMGFDTANVYVCTDPVDVVEDDPTLDGAQADIVGCGASIDGDAMTISLYMAGDIADEFGAPLTGDIQYRLRLGLEGQSNEKLVKYRDGNTTGLKSLEVVLDGNAMHFTFSLRELGRKGPLADAAVTFSAETREGAAGTGAAGLLDQMPDGGGTLVFHE